MSRVLIESLPGVDIPLKHDDIMVFYDKSENLYKKIQVSSIYESIYKTYLKQYEIGAMAFETSSEYASYDHDHDNYDNVSYTNLQNGDLIARITDSALLSTYEIRLMGLNSETDDYKYQRKDILDKIQPKFGTVQYVSGICAEIDVSSEYFDGWLYADGKQYETDIFESRRFIPKYFQTQSSGQFFTVPVISGFATLNSTIDSEENIKYSYSQQATDKQAHVSVDYNRSTAMIYVGRTTFSRV